MQRDHPKPIRFNGNHYLRRETAFSGVVNGGQGMVSFWFRNNGGGIQNIIDSDNRFAVQILADNTLRIVGINASQGVVLRMDSNASYPPESGWHHVFASWVLGSTTGHLWVDGANARAAGPTLQNFVITYVASPWGAGGKASGANLVNGDLADVWVNLGSPGTPPNDIIHKFRDPDTGRPVFLGNNGELPLGTAPTFFLHGPAGVAANAGYNFGTGGGFSAVGGSPTNSTSHPGYYIRSY